MVVKQKLSLDQQETVDKSFNKGAWLKHEFCSDFELAALYSNATVFICTSQYEGFGIPLVEAMAGGCPVIAANTSSIPEVVGHSALLFDPADSEDLSNQIDRIINDKSLSARLVEVGRMQAEKFTWDDMADTINKGYSRFI